MFPIGLEYQIPQIYLKLTLAVIWARAMKKVTQLTGTLDEDWFAM